MSFHIKQQQQQHRRAFTSVRFWFQKTSSLFFFLLLLVFVVQGTTAAAATTTTTTTTTTQKNEGVSRGETKFVIPEEFCSPYGSYPNPLDVTDEDRSSFHPVIRFPTIWMTSDANPDDEGNDDETGSRHRPRIRIPDVTVRDLTRPTDLVYIVTEEDRIKRRKQVLEEQQQQQQVQAAESSSGGEKPDYNIGRYDEDRRGLYVSELFDDDKKVAPRTIHMGIDLGGPIGTNVHAFADGVVHSIGYNPQLGDYGNVIVIEHTIPSNGRKVWALYGHLDSSTLQDGKRTKGTLIQKGQIIGRLGDIYENGGWEGAHVHFQLSLTPPETHDMPGAVTLEDRPTALVQYPDPRCVLGMLY